MSKETILIIDDEKDVQNLLTYNLKREGYETLSAASGETGLEMAKAKKPAAIILDLMLPELDGFDVCRLLQADPSTRRIPVLMLSAKSSEADHVVGLELGASDYLTKPFSVKILITRLKKLLKRGATLSEEPLTLQCCDFTLDREKHSFKLKGKSVELTKTEFGILALLMERPEAVLPRETIVTKVWGEGAVVSPTAMNMQIKGLREKLGEFREVIQTVRGTGFKIC